MYILFFLKIETFKHKQNSEMYQQIDRHEIVVNPKSQLPSTKLL